MSNTTLLSIKTDPKTKRELKLFAAELGLTSTAFVNAVVKQALRDRRVVLGDALEPTPYLKKIIHDVEEDIKHDKNIIHTNSKDEALAYLDGLMRK